MTNLIAMLEGLAGQPDLANLYELNAQVKAAGLITDWETELLFGAIIRGGIEALGAAAALVERVLPGWAYSASDGDEHGPWASVFQVGGGRSSTAVMAATPAIALCIALIRALEARDGTE